MSCCRCSQTAHATPVAVSGTAVLAVNFFPGRRRRLAAFSQASFAWVPPHVVCRSPRPEPYALARETSPSELTKCSTQSTEPRHSLSGFEQRIVTGSRCYFTRDPFVRDSLADCSATDGPCSSVTEAAGGAASLPAEKKTGIISNAHSLFLGHPYVRRYVEKR